MEQFTFVDKAPFLLHLNGMIMQQIKPLERGPVAGGGVTEMYLHSHQAVYTSKFIFKSYCSTLTISNDWLISCLVELIWSSVLQLI